MATSGSITGGASKEWYLRLDWSRTSYSVDGNYSVINADLYIYNRYYSRNEYANQAYYIIDGSKTFATYNFPSNKEWHKLGSKSITIYHENDGTKTFYLSGSWHSGLNTQYTPSDLSVGGNITLDTIPRQANVTGGTDFNDESNPTIYYSNPGGLRINARLEFGGTSINRTNISNTGSYTFSLTSAERTLLRQKCTSNSLVVREVIATCIGGTSETHWSWVDKTMTMVNANPTFSNFTFQDINPATVALTGNNQNIIRNYSNVEVTISAANKATAIKEATMSRYRFTCGDKQALEAMTYSSTNDVTGTITGVPNGTFTVIAIDSRGNPKDVQKYANEVIEYNPLSKGNISVYRSNGVSKTTTLSLSGTVNLVDFGEVVNSIKTAKYRYKQTDLSTWSNYIDITLTINQDGSFTFEDSITGDEGVEGFNINNAYNIEVLIEDELSSITFTDTLNSGTPNIALAKTGVGIMGKYNESLGGELQIAGQKVLRPYLLYQNSSGNTGTVTLSDDVYNYEFIEIFVLSTSDSGTGYAQNSTKVWQPSGKTAWLTTGYCSTGDGSYNLKLTSALLSGTLITRPYGYWEFNASSGSKTNYIGITKVIGYK